MFRITFTYVTRVAIQSRSVIAAIYPVITISYCQRDIVAMSKSTILFELIDTKKIKLFSVICSLSPKPDSEELVFPEQKPTANTAAEQQPRVESTENIKKDGNWIYVYTVVKATAGPQQYVLRELKHFATYSISVRACRSGTDRDNCSSDQSHSEKTKKKEKVDDILVYSMQVRSIVKTKNIYKNHKN